MYYRPSTGDFYELHQQIRQAFPNTSFPANITDATLADFGVFPIVIPTHDDITKNYAAGTPALVDGVWTRAWVVTAASAEEIAARKKASVPAQVTHRQAMDELIERDLVATIEGALAQLAGKAGAKARNAYTNSQFWQRDWPLIAQLQQAFGWTDDYVDDLFISAETR